MDVDGNAMRSQGGLSFGMVHHTVIRFAQYHQRKPTDGICPHRQLIKLDISTDSAV